MIRSLFIMRILEVLTNATVPKALRKRTPNVRPRDRSPFGRVALFVIFLTSDEVGTTERQLVAKRADAFRRLTPSAPPIVNFGRLLYFKKIFVFNKTGRREKGPNRRFRQKFSQKFQKFLEETPPRAQRPPSAVRRQKKSFGSKNSKPNDFSTVAARSPTKRRRRGFTKKVSWPSSPSSCS